MSESPGKLKLGALVALVVGSTIGGGIFSLPQSMVAGAGIGTILMGWTITAAGMLILVFVFQVLLCAQIKFAAKDPSMTEFLCMENTMHVPVNTLWLIHAGGIKYLLSALLYTSRRDSVCQGQDGAQQAGFHQRRQADFCGRGRGRPVAAFGLYDGFLTL